MKLFNLEPNKDLIELLEKSKMDFRFDPGQVKSRLNYSLNNTPILAPKSVSFKLKVMSYSVALASLLIFLSATFVFASYSQPGDKLFTLNKWGENAILSLPLSYDQNARLQTQIVTKRLQFLNDVATAPADGAALENRKLQIVKESDESLKNAIEAIFANKSRLQASGQTQAVQRLNIVLNQLDDLAAQHQQRVQELEDGDLDDQIKANIEIHLSGIKNTRHKARIELELEDENEGEDD